ncbi:MAG: alpha-ketoglutarate-dependent dioxygenase AlkB [Hyphomicrobiaceae bacterium]|nr:alpha-ketoglutarate-dependent dioxygenase AlkB [Hyphomicrobiaceae bacterium]
MRIASPSGEIEILGFRYFPDFLDRPAQEALARAIRDVVRAAPLFQPTMPKTGKPFSVRMSNCGELGGVSDKAGGYRYQPTHPATGAAWPPIPAPVMDIWHAVADYPHPPQACLINWYEPEARMGLHQDRDEADLAAPVVSISLGDSCRFRVGGDRREAATKSFELRSGDVVVFGGAARLGFHGVDRILPGTSTLLDAPGRVNLTLRRVTSP